MKTTKVILSVILILSLGLAIGQKGKNGTPTLTYPAYVNEYTSLTSDAVSGSVTISVDNSSLNSNGRFTGSLEPGDLIMIIQIQGVDIIGYPEPWTLNETYGLPLDPSWGEITNYNNCGNNEFAEVRSVPNGASIELRCGLSNTYSSAGIVQIVRVPRYEDLTVSGTLTTDAWNGSLGGIIAIEVSGDAVITGSGEILASELGFRGAAPNTGVSSYGVSHWSRPLPDAGGLKGESVRGWGTEYDIHGGRYSFGSPANGGGGGAAHNGGGGGGANAGDFLNWNEGVGVPFGTYNAWTLEATDITGFISTGGGRGGYTFSGANLNPNSVAPGDGGWGGDNRQNSGGLGGRPLDYSTGRIFLGGAGGAADLNESSSIGGAGGNGGGIVYILNYGTVSGSGNITSNGEDGEDVTASSASFGNIAGNDGAGGGGAGGTIIINSDNTITGISINGNGGDGGNQQIIYGLFASQNEAEGPGGGGGGGYIAISNGAISRFANGGSYGETNSPVMNPDFPMNGSTSGGQGLPNETISNFFLTTADATICSGSTATLTAAGNGTSAGVITWYDAEVGGSVIGTDDLITGVLTSDTMFWVGTCPGNYLTPVSVIISPTVDTSSLLLINDVCAQGSGSLTGITVNGGSTPYNYSWNGTNSLNADTTELFAGTYTLTITDNTGCIFTTDPYTIIDNLGPTMDSSSIAVSPEICFSANGSITGITASGGLLPYTYLWDLNSSISEDTIGLQEGTYTLTVTDGNGCSSSMGPIIVGFIGGPSIDPTLINITNEDCYSGNGSITGISVIGGTTPYSYTWNGISGNLDATNLTNSDYTLVVTDDNGCTDSFGAVSVSNSGAPIADFYLSGNSLSLGETLVLNNNSSNGAVTYLWNLADGTTSSDFNPSVTYTSVGSYSICLIAYTATGCADTTCQTVEVIEEVESVIGIPTAFSPNNDMQNDVLFVRGSGIKSFTLLIYNRYGEKVFESNELSMGWDGTYKGKSQNTGVFVYYLEYEYSNGDKGSLKGNITLVK